MATSISSRAMVMAQLTWLSGCSFGMQGLDPKWDGSYEPTCSDATITLDRTMGAAFLVAGAGAITTNANTTGATIGSITVGLAALYLVSASVGAKTFATCQMARTQWSFNNAIKARDPGGGATTSATAVATRPPATGVPAAERPVIAATDTEPLAAAPHADLRPWAVGVSDHEQASALALYVEGNRQFIQNHFARALAKYKEAIAHWDHPAIRFNMAISLINLDQPVEARDNLERSLQYGSPALGADAYAQGLKYREQLDSQLVRLTIDCAEPDEEVMLDGMLVFKGPGVVDRFLLPGDHQLAATKRGYIPASKRIVLVAGKPVTYTIQPLVAPRATEQ